MYVSTWLRTYVTSKKSTSCTSKIWKNHSYLNRDCSKCLGMLYMTAKLKSESSKTRVQTTTKCMCGRHDKCHFLRTWPFLRHSYNINWLCIVSRPQTLVCQCLYIKSNSLNSWSITILFFQSQDCKVVPTESICGPSKNCQAEITPQPSYLRWWVISFTTRTASWSSTDHPWQILAYMQTSQHGYR